MESVKGAVKGVAKSLGAGDMDTRQLLTQGVNLGEALIHTEKHSAINLRWAYVLPNWTSQAGSGVPRHMHH